MSDLARRPRRRDGVLAQGAHGRTVLLRLEDGSYYSIDEVGGRIWELCDGVRPLQDIASILEEEFDAPPETIRIDLLEFVADLESEGLLVEPPG